jgi:hypothetical protein
MYNASCLEETISKTKRHLVYAPAKTLLTHYSAIRIPKDAASVPMPAASARATVSWGT